MKKCKHIQMSYTVGLYEGGVPIKCLDCGEEWLGIIVYKSGELVKFKYETNS